MSALLIAGIVLAYVVVVVVMAVSLGRSAAAGDRMQAGAARRERKR